MKNFKKIIILTLAIVMIMSSVVALSACDKGEGKPVVKVIDIKLTEEDYAFGVAKNNATLLTAVNDLLVEIKANGQFDAILDAYFADGTPTGIASATLGNRDNQLVVATNAAFPPFEYLEGDTYYGIDLAIAKLLADKLNKELVILNVNFDAVLQNVESGAADIAMAGLTVNEARKEIVNFSNTYFNASQKLIVKADDTTFDACKTVADVEAILNAWDKAKTIGVQLGTTGQFYVEGDEDFGFTGYACTCKGYASGAQAVQDMLSGNIVAVIIDEAPAAKIAEAVNALQ